MFIIIDIDDIKKSRLTLSLIFINSFCFIAFNYLLNVQYFYLLVQYNLAIFEGLEYWRLFTAMFLHADVMHLFSNMIALLLFGTVIEMEYSKVKYLIIYFMSGLLGNVVSLFLLPVYTISLGASGAIFGLVGAAFAMIAQEEDKSLLYLGLIYVGYFILMSFAPGINLWAHLFGLLGGVLFGFLFSKKRKYQSRY